MTHPNWTVETILNTSAQLADDWTQDDGTLHAVRELAAEMLTYLAERIAQDEKAVPVAYITTQGKRKFLEYTVHEGVETVIPLYTRPSQPEAREMEGWALVPRTATEDMLDAGRSAVMARDCSAEKWGPEDHYKASGISREGIPDRLFDGRGKMSKAWCAELVYCAMIAAAPRPAKGE